MTRPPPDSRPPCSLCGGPSPLAAKLLTICETARILRVSQWTVRREISRGHLRPTRVGRAVFVGHTVLHRYLRDRGL